jgi:hypothetical protein
MSCWIKGQERPQCTHFDLAQKIIYRVKFSNCLEKCPFNGGNTCQFDGICASGDPESLDIGEVLKRLSLKPE